MLAVEMLSVKIFHEIIPNIFCSALPQWPHPLAAPGRPPRLSRAKPMGPGQWLQLTILPFPYGIAIGEKFSIGLSLLPNQKFSLCLEVWPESHWPGFALRQSEVLQTGTA